MSADEGLRVPVVKVRLVRERAVRCKPRVPGSSTAAVIAVELLRDWDRECFLTIHLDTKGGAIGVETIAVGTLNSVLVHPREVWKGALLANSCKGEGSLAGDRLVS